MNDFSDLENELKRLRPRPISPDFLSRIEEAMSQPGESGVPARTEAWHRNIIPLPPPRMAWLLGGTLAAAAAILLMVQINLGPQNPKEARRSASAPQRRTSDWSSIAAQSPNTVARADNRFLPTGATQVVYDKQDEGLLFPTETEQPVRRLRFRTHETLRWQNPATGASLRVSYPSEQVELIPVSGQ